MKTFAKAVQHSVNQLIINTIDDAEKMLLKLPRNGDCVEVITSSSPQNIANPIGPQARRTTKDVVLDKVTTSDSQKSRKSTSEVSSSSCTFAPPGASKDHQPGQNEIKRTPSQFHEANKSFSHGKAEIVPGSVQVSPLSQMEGMMIDLVVTIKIKSGDSKTMKMQLECPHFQPKRVRIDGIWHNIV